jgi:hypothetical protein
MARTFEHSAPALAALARDVESAWAADTSTEPERWSATNPAWGQCAVTALVIQDALGGDLLRARVDGVSHYWNRLPSGEQVDLTRRQFLDGGRLESPPELRTREYVLSFPDTGHRYARLRERLAGLRSHGSA